MRTAIFGLVLGIALLQQQAALWDLTYYLICLAVLVSVSALLFFRRLRFFTQVPAIWSLAWSIGLHFILAASIGFCWAGIFAHQHLRHQLPAGWEGRDIDVIGVIDSLPGQSERGLQFNFQVEKYLLSDVKTDAFPRRLALAWYEEADKTSKPPALKPGQRWQLKVRLKRPHGNANPYGFDYEVWLLEQGLRATGTVRSKQNDDLSENQKLDDFVLSMNNVIERTRHILHQRIFQALPDAHYAGVLSALVVGDQRDIAPADWTVFNRTGIGHLISISGLHITMIAGLFAGLLHFLWRHSFFTSAQLPLLIPAQKVAVLAGVIAAVIYVALAGFGVPAQRTLWMLVVLAMALWTNRASDSLQVLSLALAVVVLIDPWAVLWPGFWLSFAAVALLLYVSVGRGVLAQDEEMQTGFFQRLRLQLYLAAQTQYAITIGLVPLTLLLFAQISLISPLANAIAIPLISFIVTPLALIGSVLPLELAAPCLRIAHACVSYLAQFLEWLSHSSFAVWQAPLPSWWMFVLAILGVAMLLAPRGIPLRYLGALCCLPIFVQPIQAPEQHQMQVTVFDIGQGAAVLIETARHKMLYDTGPGFSRDVNSGTRILLPYFQARGIVHLDQLMISHSDNDHSGGALSLLKNLKIDQLSSSLPATHPIVRAASKSQRCEAGQRWEWDGVQFEILHPVPVIYTSDKWKTNALSCTLKISTKTHSLLLAGDIEAIQEDELVNSIPDKLAANVLLAPHHGSGTSSTMPFLLAVKPELALFQVGYLNRYHHPKAEVMQRYLGIGIKPLRTDTSGAITLQFGSAINVEEYRRQHARYWYP
ncbi:DNA internalization-related competence protein ComEC/Rec2 [Undibacterium flavidum]|uniref:DNA internalization-related competence protein ComEC/Rec2 n=1 Tax=Undibacterium flavidum TaxID=2762297 RepID=A0ABR6Y6C7_9BURK|nr:DNA internalization-related competence protein ComEC/Rec2 [Undibacterium flavidum]MBC3872177.1 DNA internalization-related competence protein ComEC/Rec2 [Undibacterium flavidum]